MAIPSTTDLLRVYLTIINETSTDQQGVAEGLGKDIKRLATGKDVKSRAGQEIAKSQDASMKGDTKTSKKHFDRYDKLDKLANKEQGMAEDIKSKSFLNYLEDTELTEDYNSGDGFIIETSEDEGIETYIIESWDDAILIAADRTTLNILEELGLLSEAGPAVSLPTQKIKVPPVPAMPQPPQGVEGEPRQNGGMGYDLGQGSELLINSDGTRTYSGSLGTFTYDKAGKAIKYNSPNLGGLASEVDLTSGGQTTNYNVGDIAMSQDTDAAGKITGTNAAYTLAGQTASMSTDASGKKTTSMTPVPMQEGSISDTFEAEYQGRKVPLGKRMAGDVKKSKVYVRKPNGKVVKVNFGDKNMTIKKHLPGHRKSFRARHNCDNPGPRWKARYWSCRAW
jgi:hypothetical protein